MTDAAAHWSGRMRLGLGWATYHGPVGDNAPHAHHAVQIAIGDGPFSFEVAGCTHDDAAGVVIAADRRHRLRPYAAVALTYLEGESDLGVALGAACADGYRLLDADAAAHVGGLIRQSVPGDRVAAELLRRWNTPAAARAPEPALATRIRRLLADPEALPPDSTGAAIAAQLCVSPSRFRHAFRAATGMAVRPYLRWRRLLQAAARVAAGASLTTAAHDAGFADAAHLSRTFRRHFGMAPSAVFGRMGDIG